MIDKRKKYFLASLSVAAVSGSMPLAAGYQAGWSDWSTTRSGIAGEVSRPEYRYQTVTAWSACDGNHQVKPADGFYNQGSYDPKNCYNCTANSCNGWACSSTGCTGWGCVGSHYWVCTTCDSGCWSCNHGCTDYGCTGWACNSWKCDTATYACPSNKWTTCYATPTAWSSWSAWGTEAVSKTTSRNVQTRTVYSYPLTYTIKFNGNGATTGSMGDISASYVNSTALSANAFARTGYVFDGWATSAGGSIVARDKASVTAAAVGAQPGGSVTLFAKWLRSYNRYSAKCLVDANDNLVKDTTTIVNNGNYKIKELYFDIPVEDTSKYDFCFAKETPTKSINNHNGYSSGVYYWENNQWVKK